jgi:hypothetical protein
VHEFIYCFRWLVLLAVVLIVGIPVLIYYLIRLVKKKSE